MGSRSKKITNKTIRSKGEKVLFALVFAFLALYSLSMLYPFFWLITNSLKTKLEYGTNQFNLPVENIVTGKIFVNFVEAWTKIRVRDQVGVFGMFTNSLWYAVGGAAVQVTFCTLTAYIISKYKFWGSPIIYWVAIAQMMIPIVGSLPAQYKLFYNLNLMNNPLLLVAFASGLGGYFLIVKSTFDSVSNSYMEAARIDGAGHYRIFFQIMLPQAIAPVFTLFLLSFITYWNDYSTPLLYLPEMPTLVTGLMVFEKEMNASQNWPIFYAGTVILLMPVLLVFSIFANRIMESISMGGLKG